MLSQTYVMLQVPQAIIELFFGLTHNRVLMLIIINLFLFLVGMIVNDATGMILVAPLLLPLVKELGIHPIHSASSSTTVATAMSIAPVPIGMQRIRSFSLICPGFNPAASSPIVA